MFSRRALCMRCTAGWRRAATTAHTKFFWIRVISIFDKCSIKIKANKFSENGCRTVSMSDAIQHHIPMWVGLLQNEKSQRLKTKINIRTRTTREKLSHTLWNRYDGETWYPKMMLHMWVFERVTCWCHNIIIIIIIDMVATLTIQYMRLI